MKFVPSYLFGSKVTETPSWTANPNLQTAFEKKANGTNCLMRQLELLHWIDEKARADELKSLGITLGDNKPTLNLFVMSQCPFGVSAEQALKPVTDLFGDKIDFQLDYIVSETAPAYLARCTTSLRQMKT